MEINTILYIAFIMYLIIMIFGYFFKAQWLFMIAGLLWFIPIFEIDNLFITLIGVIMLVFHGILGFYDSSESEW